MNYHVDYEDQQRHHQSQSNCTTSRPAAGRWIDVLLYGAHWYRQEQLSWPPSAWDQGAAWPNQPKEEHLLAMARRCVTLKHGRCWTRHQDDGHLKQEAMSTGTTMVDRSVRPRHNEAYRKGALQWWPFFVLSFRDLVIQDSWSASVFASSSDKASILWTAAPTNGSRLSLPKQRYLLSVHATCIPQITRINVWMVCQPSINSHQSIRQRKKRTAIYFTKNTPRWAQWSMINNEGRSAPSWRFRFRNWRVQ